MRPLSAPCRAVGDDVVDGVEEVLAVGLVLDVDEGPRELLVA